MKTSILTLVLAVVCSIAYAQRCNCGSNSHRNDSYHRHDSYDRQDRRRSNQFFDDERGGRKSSIIISSRSGRWELSRLDNNNRNQRYDWRDSDRERDFDRRPPRSPMQVFTFGPKVGLNYSTLMNNPVELDADYRTGYHIGGFMRFNVRRAYLQPEVLYSTKGGNIILADIPGAPYQAGQYGISINSIDVPLLLGARIISSRSFNLRAMAGPMASFNLSGFGLENFLNENEVTRDYLEPLIFAYHAGLGVDLGPITIDTRYEWSMAGVANLERAGLGRPRSGLFQVSLGIKMF
jgi:hypothetical protein